MHPKSGAKQVMAAPLRRGWNENSMINFSDADFKKAEEEGDTQAAPSAATLKMLKGNGALTSQ